MPLTFTEQLAAVSEHQQAADALAAQVIRRAEAGGVAVSSDVRREALALIRRLAKGRLAPLNFLSEFLNGFRKILHRYEPVMARTISDARLAAWLRGGQGVLAVLPPIDTFHVPPASHILDAPEPGPAIVKFPIIEAAAADLRSRGILTPEYFGTQAGRSRLEGLTLARVASLDALEKMRDALIDAVVEGDTLSMFREKAAAAFDASKLSPTRQEMLFRNHVMAAYAAGQKAVVEHPLVRSAAVFAWRSEIDDSRLTPLCRALSVSGLEGTSIYCVQDPVWAIVAPPSHRGCRCGTIFLTVQRAAAKGLKVAQKWLETGVRPPDSELFVPLPELGHIPPKEAAAFSTWQSPWALAA